MRYKISDDPEIAAKPAVHLQVIKLSNAGIVPVNTDSKERKP